MSHAPFPQQGRLLGIDFGTKRLGFAVSNAERTIASPLANYTRRNRDVDAMYIAGLVAEYGIVGLVVGLPVHISGDEGEKARQARRWGNRLAARLNLPVRFHDERYSSVVAEAHLLAADLSRKKRKTRRDKVAAQFILQSFLEAEDADRPPEDLSEA